MDLMISFDTTGSMYPCLSVVKQNVDKLVKYMFEHIEGLNVSIISHGDHCDGPNWMSYLPFTRDEKAVSKFIVNAPQTGGGDAPEAYEDVIKKAASVAWHGERKAFVLIGDDVPHNTSWKLSAGQLRDAGVSILPIQCLGNKRADGFYNDLGSYGEVGKLELHQFKDIEDLLLAIAFSKSGTLAQFEEQLKSRGASQNTWQNVDILAGRKKRSVKKSEHNLHAVEPWRFQVLDVPRDTAIKDFVTKHGLLFKTGKGFYEFTKPVVIQDYKEVVIQDKETGEMFTGAKAREILGIPDYKAKVGPDKLTKYRGFVQSTSNNRKLLGGTKFLYEAV